MSAPANIVDAGPTLAGICGGSQIFIFMALLDGIFKQEPDIYGPMCTLQSIETPAPNTKYDYIVVGAGSAGCVVASRLSEDPDCRVLLIEAGGTEPVGLQVPLFSILFFGSSIDWQYPTQPNGKSYLSFPGQALNWSSGKMLGGSSTMNSMLYVRGNPADYERWAQMGNPGWDYAGVLPYFKRTENNTQFTNDPYHGTDGPMTIGDWWNPDGDKDWLAAAREAGFPVVDDYNGAQQTGFVETQANVRAGVRQSTARAYLEPARDRKNLDVWLNTRVTRVLFDEFQRAIGVETIDAKGKWTKVLADAEVILSAGSIESPKLLLLSGIGPIEDLQEVGITPVVDLPAVGKNLQDHVGIRISYNLQQQNQEYLSHDVVDRYLESRTGPLSAQSSWVTAKLVSKYAPGPSDPDLHIYFNTDLASKDNLCSQLGFKSRIRTDHSIGMALFALRPQSRGYLRLASADPLAPPTVFPNLLDVDADVDTLLDGIAKIERLMDTSVYRQYNVSLVPALGTPCMQLPISSEAYWRCVVRHRTIHGIHKIGTCRMGPFDDPLGAVVDAELRVYGVDGLRVIDASVMPTIVSANTGAATMMVAEKAVEMVRKTWSMSGV